MLYQLGTFYPFFRAHNEINYQKREPWLQSERVQSVIRDAIMLRYDLINYIYTAFYFASTDAVPIFTAMWSEWPKEPTYLKNQSQFMFGRNILVCPKLTPKNETTSEFGSEHFIVWCSLPETQHSDEDSIDTYPAKWYDWYTKHSRAGSHSEFVMKLPDEKQGIFVRGGSIIPIMPH